jgi:hypothetical protein
MGRTMALDVSFLLLSFVKMNDPCARQRQLPGTLKNGRTEHLPHRELAQVWENVNYF